MKTKAFITVLLLSANILSISAQKDLFSKLSENQNITTVTITKALLNMAPAFIGNSMEGIEISKLIGKLDQIDILTSDNKEVSRQMKITVENHFAKDKTYEVLMKIKDGTDNVTFYVEKDNNIFKSLIMVVEDAEDYTLIRLTGNFTAEDIQGVMKN